MPRQVWSDEQKAEALRLYTEVGPAEASRRTGIPKGTIASLAHRGGVQTVATANTREAIVQAALRWEQRRTELTDRIGQAAEMALSRTIELLGDGGSTSKAKDCATTMAILVDKAQLLSGAATSRNEHVKVANLDEELRVLTGAEAQA